MLRLCVSDVVDKSVHLLGTKNRISLSSFFDRLKNLNLRRFDGQIQKNDDAYCRAKRESLIWSLETAAKTAVSNDISFLMVTVHFQHRFKTDIAVCILGRRWHSPETVWSLKLYHRHIKLWSWSILSYYFFFAQLVAFCQSFRIWLDSPSKKDARRKKIVISNWKIWFSFCRSF